MAEKTHRSEPTPAKREVSYSKSKPPPATCHKYEVRRSNSVPNAPSTDVEQVTRTLRLRRKISLTDKPSSKFTEKPEKKPQRASATRVNSTLKNASRKLEKQLENQEIRGLRAKKAAPPPPALDQVNETSPDFTDNPKLELFLPVTEDFSSVDGAQDSESGISSPSQDIASGIPSGPGNPDPPRAPHHLRTVPPIIISAASVAATCVKLVRVRTRLDGGKDHFETRWGYKARRRAAARRAALEKERQEREQREQREGAREDSQQEDSIVSEDGKYFLANIESKKLVA